MITNHSRAVPRKWHDIARIFEALGDEQRQRIVLSFEPKEQLNVSQISEGSKLARSTVSHHLKVLHDSGVLRRRKEGKEVYYWIDKKFLEKSFGNVMDYLRDYV